MSNPIKKYPDTKASPDFAALEENIQKFWQENEVFVKSLEKNKHNNKVADYIFYDGPPLLMVYLIMVIY